MRLAGNDPIHAYLLGTIELTTAALLGAGAFIPILSALGSLMGIGTFAITWSAIDAVRRVRQRCWRYDWVLDLVAELRFSICERKEQLNGDCPRRDAHGLHERCDLICPDLPKVL